ncbi:MAG: NAD-glutamate dehydrogenase [Deltaproteobacteria bacterium]|nr:NAD-glutamate dehydrogenase [Deltaproteobacteria bacterium]
MDNSPERKRLIKTFEQQLASGSDQETHPLLAKYGEAIIGHGPQHLLGTLRPEALVGFVNERLQFVLERPPAPYKLRLTDIPHMVPEAPGGLQLLEVMTNDRAFLIDSLQAMLLAYNCRIYAFIHPILQVKRDSSGVITDIRESSKGGKDPLESHIFFIISAVPAGLRQTLLEESRAVLDDVIQCVDDFPQFLEQMEQLHAQAAEGDPENPLARLIKWFNHDQFIYMGVLHYSRSGKGKRLEPVEKDSSGLFLNPDSTPHREALLNQVTRLINRAPANEPYLIVEETDTSSRMRRRSLMSALLVSPPALAEKGRAVAVVGIFSNRSLRANVKEIPLVKDKLESLMRRMKIPQRSYAEREVLNHFSGMPRFELFRLPEKSLEGMMSFFLQVLDHPRVEISIQPDEGTDTYRILVSIPGQEFPLERRQRLREGVETMLSATAQNFFLVRASTFMVINIVFDRYSAMKKQLPEEEAIARAIRLELRTREERLVQRWREQAQGKSTNGLGQTLVSSFPGPYLMAHSDSEVLRDMAYLERLASSGNPQFDLRPLELEDGVKMTVYSWGKFSLSRIMPILDNMRVLVQQEETYHLNFPERVAYLHMFILQSHDGISLDPNTMREKMQDLIFMILDNRLENDRLNALMPVCGFTWKRIALLRLYRNYLMQVGTVYTKHTIEETLIRQARATRALVEVFDARFNPDIEGRETAIKAAKEEMDDAEREISSLTEDRIFKALYNLISASERTNYYQDIDNPIIAVKLASGRIEQLPIPRPLYEIFVYGPLMEGIHLRGDMVARGGIRYSDRPDDFRTEVLGLMATQMKKNALIVPLGSKGGFVVKRLEPFEGDVRRAGDESYAVFMRALLSLTDNLEMGRVVPPQRVVRHDGDDPYLVVAADKGTAHLSDTANKVAEEEGFWLGDAFASGGSNGYDHKVVGITARGAWESVKRLFMEIDVDVQKDAVTVVGIGDMSGDVFGNGMLLSHTLKLVGAFDHRHVFIDPDPDPEVSWNERKRLFGLPRSSWEDYDKKLISQGGGIWPRGSKEIPLSSQMKTLLGSTAEFLSGEEMVRTLLTLPVDLLWNGGIGTYVKAQRETNTDVGDPNNDAVRVNASDLHCRVVGEGGNLGFTQAARIEFGMAGGLINTDAIDNAAGVNMSDHEVNLKILLRTFIEDGRLPTRDARNQLLSQLTDGVTESVLYANFRQVLLISMDSQRSSEDLNPFLRLIDSLAVNGGLDRRSEHIPSVPVLKQGFQDGRGVPRPVLSVLLAYSKMYLYKVLTKSALMNDPFFQETFESYFPRVLSEKFILANSSHPLRNQIIATDVTNRVIDQAGMTFTHETMAFNSAPADEVVRCYLICDAVLEAPALRRQVYEFNDRMPAQDQYRVLVDLENLLSDMTRWMLTQKGQEAVTFETIGELKEDLKQFRETLPLMLEGDEIEETDAIAQEALRIGFSKENSLLCSQLHALKRFLPVRALARKGGVNMHNAFMLTVLMDERLGMDRLEEALEDIHPESPWQQQYLANLRRGLLLIRQSKLESICECRREGAEPETCVQDYLVERKDAYRRYMATLSSALSQEHPEIVALGLVVDMLQSL